MTILGQVLEGTGLIAILGHIRPDGDCLGSASGLYNYPRLSCPDIRAAMYLEEVSDKFGYLREFDEIRHWVDRENYELCVYLDYSDVGRLGEFSNLLAQAKESLCLNHHVINTRLADSSLVIPEASSTCEVLYGQLDEEKIDIWVAECLYTGIIHDTGVFKYSCTLRTTMEIAGKLMAKGIDFGSTIDNDFYKKTYIQNRILRKVLPESITFFDGKCTFSATRQNEMRSYGVNNKDMDGIINQLRPTDGAEVAILLHQTGTQKYKVSMCSQSLVDVNRIIIFFGGSGHVRAAGCTMTGGIHDVINNLSGHTTERLEPKAADRTWK